MKTKCVEEMVYLAVLAGELEIDNEGQVWRLACRRGASGGTVAVPCERRRAESPMKKYLGVRVMYNNVRYQALAHRLVYRHFYGSIPQHLTVNHKNGKHRDNAPSNLELATQAEQIQHAIHITKTSYSIRQYGELSHKAKLTLKQVREIRRRHAEGETQAALAREFRTHFGNIHSIIKGVSWREWEWETEAVKA